MMTQQEFDIILEKHRHWLDKDVVGWENMKADLSGQNLSKLNLSSANLYEADLSGCNLLLTDLSYTLLTRANLCDADLSEANLRHASLLRANLSNANLLNANLRYANLEFADLEGSCLDGAILSGADLHYAVNVPYIPTVCPDKGSFIGYKKATGGIIVELEICEDARRISATGRKCRCDKAKVLSLTYPDGTEADVTEVASAYDSWFVYKVGEIVKELRFDDDRFNECSRGIHFFINRQEAVNYYLG